MNIARGTVVMNCGIISLLIGLGGLGSYSNAAPISGASEECCSLSSSCHWMGLTSRRLCLPPPCDRWNLNELCAKLYESFGDSPSDISGDIQNNNDISPAPTFKSNNEQLPGTNTIAKPDRYVGKYGSLGNGHIRTRFPHHKLFESKCFESKTPQPNELHFKLVLPLPAKDFLSMGLRLFCDRQHSHSTSESPEVEISGKSSSKIEDQINSTVMQTKPIETGPEQSGKIMKEKEDSNFAFQSSNDSRRKLVSKRSPQCCNVDGNQSNSRPRGRSNVHISTSRSDGCGISASAAHHGSSFAFGNGQGTIEGNNYRIPTLRQSDFPKLPFLPQLPALPRLPNMPFF